jgi:hypothetical protein
MVGRDQCARPNRVATTFLLHVPQCRLSLAGSMSAISDRILSIGPSFGRRAASLVNAALYDGPNARTAEGGRTALRLVRRDGDAPIAPIRRNMSLSII